VYPFLLHPIPVVGLNLPLALWLRANDFELWYWRYETVGGEIVVAAPDLALRLKGCVSAFVHLAYAFVVTWLLATPRCRAKCRWLVEPWWIVCRKGPPGKAKEG